MSATPMSGWRDRCEALPDASGTRHRIMRGDAALSFLEAVRLLAADASFRGWLTGTLAAAPVVAFRWETPALSASSAARPFEFALIEDRLLDRTPDPDAFGAHFRGPTASVIAIPNLDRTSELIVPRAIADPGVYAHFAAFLRGAPGEQIHALWRAVAASVLARLSDRPLWLSTAGTGVAWLHVRVDPVPKYYAHRPYRTAPEGHP